MFGLLTLAAGARSARGVRVLALAAGLAAAGCSSENGLVSSAKETARGIYGILLGGVSKATGLGLGSERNVSLGQFTLKCPELEVRAGSAHYIFYDPNAPQSPKTVRYQGTLTQTARECEFKQSSIVFKFGFAGRVLLGPRGQPRDVEMPVRVLLAWQGDQVAWTKVYKIPVTIPQDETSGFFVHVEENFDFEVPVGTQLSDYRLYIGFDADSSRDRAVPASERGSSRFQ